MVWAARVGLGAPPAHNPGPAGQPVEPDGRQRQAGQVGVRAGALDTVGCRGLRAGAVQMPNPIELTWE